MSHLKARLWLSSSTSKVVRSKVEHLDPTKLGGVAFGLNRDEAMGPRYSRRPWLRPRQLQVGILHHLTAVDEITHNLATLHPGFRQHPLVSRTRRGVARCSCKLLRDKYPISSDACPSKQCSVCPVRLVRPYLSSLSSPNYSVAYKFAEALSNSIRRACGETGLLDLCRDTSSTISIACGTSGHTSRGWDAWHSACLMHEVIGQAALNSKCSAICKCIFGDADYEPKYRRRLPLGFSGAK